MKEMKSSQIPTKLNVDEVLYEVCGKHVRGTHGGIALEVPIDLQMIMKQLNETVESGVDIVLNHRIYETYAFNDKEFYTLYLMDYMKKLLAKLEETAFWHQPDQVDVFKTSMSKVMKDILGRLKDLQFFTGESLEIDSIVAMVENRDVNGESGPVVITFKHGLKEEN
ncbi:hypothetical protein WA026_014925 [Henosepilachna vigintioctopunctata]|uniref:Translationally-controlled tumor protein homolog n=1 Tax=Henosepilachna vigintioctopunctata TaxID=420089 RepID=A0AAW1UYG4_9CUCU